LAKKRKRTQTWKKHHQRSFQDSDLEWLAEQFQKQTRLDMDLTIEEFAIQHGVQADMISSFIHEGQETDRLMDSSLRTRWQRKYARERGRNRRWISNYNWLSFTSSDFAQLAEEFQKQVEVNPDLTLESFAIQHGVQAEWISRFIHIDEGMVSLWHGTTEDRARAIMEQGFRVPKSAGGRVWFAKMPNFARRVASARAQHRRKMPVAISCKINLGKYPKYNRPAHHTYAFNSSIGKEVICGISVVKLKRWFYFGSKKRAESIGGTLTKTSKKSGVLAWINHYLEQGDEEAVSEDHPAVEVAFQWVEAQYAQGREGAISNEEILSMVMILRSIPGLEMGNLPLLEDEEDETELVDVMITKNAGKLGVLYWINRYLELKEEEPIDENHPAVESLFKWVEAEYATGREGHISDEEMLTQLTTRLE